MSRYVEKLEAAIRELAADGVRDDEAWDALVEAFDGEWRRLDFALRVQQRERLEAVLDELLGQGAVFVERSPKWSQTEKLER